jgi:hypothetical protein
MQDEVPLPSDLVRGIAPPEKKFDPCTAAELFRARVKCHHKQFFAFHRTLAFTYTEKGSILEFEPKDGGYWIGAYIVLDGEEFLKKAYLNVDDETGVVGFSLTAQVFKIQPQKVQYEAKLKNEIFL